MERSSNNRTPLIVAILLLIMAISVLIAAYDFRGGSGIFPRFIGWIFVGLTLSECMLQLKKYLSQSDTSSSNVNVLTKDKIIKEIQGIFWIGFFLFSLYLTGFIMGIPLYMFAFLRWSAKRSYKQCMIMSVAATIIVYALFIELLQYRLFPGILFGA
jgi:hypothetical protein